MSDWKEMEAGSDLDAIVGTAAGFDVRWFDTGFGRAPYAYNELEGPKNIIGGGKQRGRDDSGEIVEFFGRLLPAYSHRLEEAISLFDVKQGWTLQYLPPLSFYGDGYYSCEVGMWKGTASTPALAVCRAWLAMSEAPRATQ